MCFHSMARFKNPKLKPEISRCVDASVKLLKEARSANDVADLLEVPIGQLLYILYKTPEDRRYVEFEIPKKMGGVRKISSPQEGTSILQAKLQPILERLYRVKAPVHGFVKGRGILTNARNHVRKRFLFNLDLEDFFGSINFGRVRGLFMAKPLSLGAKAATVLAKICTFRNAVPQGAVTSPVISNLIATDLDRRLTFLAKKYKLRYSRYADDISFSSSRKTFPRSIGYWEGENPVSGEALIGDVLQKEIDLAGFKVNDKKVRFQIPGIRQEVTGLTVNEFPNVQRRFVRKIRSLIYSWEKHGLIEAEKEHLLRYSKNAPSVGKEGHLDGEYYRSVVYGHLAYLKMVRGENDDIYIRLCLKVAEVETDVPEFLEEIKKMHEQFEVFISHASEDKAQVARPLFEACGKRGIISFLDEKYISWGDSLTEKINHALGQSKYVVAILSETSINKAWPAKEINAALAREINGEQKVLPLIVGNPDLSSLPLLQDKFHLRWNDSADDIAEKLQRKISSDKKKRG